MYDKLKNVLLPEPDNSILTEDKLNFKTFFLASIFLTALAVFLNNPANSINFKLFGFQEVFRFNLVIPMLMISAMVLGPAWGALIAGGTDVVSYFIWYNSSEYVFLLTLTTIILGFAAGYLFQHVYKNFSFRAVFFSLAVPYLIISGFANPLILYYKFSIPIVDNLQIRLLTIIIAIPLYSAAGYYIINYFIKSKKLKVTNQKLKELIKYDTLTGLYNRRKFNEHLGKFIPFSKRHNEDFSLMMIDLDDFKKFNDKYGHQGGDEVLKAVGKVLADEVREEDIAARFGGDEFVVLLAGSDSTEAVNLAERIKDKITGIELENIDDQITASFGISSLKMEDDEDSFISRADKALYLAKKQEGNCVKKSLN